MPQVEFGQMGNGETGFADNTDPFEDDLEEALCVFKSGDNNNDIIQKNEKLIMFYVDLENEIIIRNSNSEENKQDTNEELTDAKHPVLFNQYPIA